MKYRYNGRGPHWHEGKELVAGVVVDFPGELPESIRDRFDHTPIESAPSVPIMPVPVNDADLRIDGPTLEEWEAAGYKAETYPPQEYAEKPSPRLDEYRAQQLVEREPVNAETIE